MHGSGEVFFHENSPNYKGSKLQESVGDTHVCRSVVLGGCTMGYSYDRARHYGAGWDPSIWRWVGAEDHQNELESVLRRSVQGTGDMYLVAPPKEVRQHYRNKAAVRGAVLEGDFDIHSPLVLSKVLPPGHVDRLLEWREWLEENPEHAGVDGSFLCDLDHHPGSRSIGGPYWPTMPTHNSIFSFARSRLATSMECFTAHGLHVYPETSTVFSYPHRNILDSLDIREQMLLLGNSLLLPCVCAWVMYVWSNLESVEDMSPLVVQPDFVTTVSDDSDE